jgi:hypothetical protein
MLPNWAQLLDVAARLCAVSQETRDWFSRFTKSSGVDDARTIVAQIRTLQEALRTDKQGVVTNLQRTRSDGQASRIVAAWEYTLETIIQQADGKQTCSWTVEGIEDAGEGDFGDGDVTLRRV